MQVVYERCAGLDVHQKTVVACVLVSGANGTVQDTVRTFSTMTADLARLSAWLGEQQVACVALESTGVFWVPVFNLLEEAGLPVVLVNPQHMKAVPGHKTDIADSKWLADLLRHGLLKASFIPPAAVRELRELLRYRKTLVGERSQEINRLQKVLESANIKLTSVASDILGVSGRQMLEALAAGEEDPVVLAEFAKRRLRAKLDQLRQALEGRVKAHHRTLIRSLLAHISFLQASIEDLDEEVGCRLAPFQREMVLLQSIPGVSKTAAAAIVAEIGVDMDRFASGHHLASWAGVCPGNKQSGGTRLSGKTTNGNVWLRGILGQVAWAAIRTKGSSFSARFRRIARRQGKQKAVVAVMHNLLLVIYALLRDHVPYDELGADYYQPQDPARRARAHVRHLEQLGFTVTLVPHEAA
jgi:transposase